MLAAAGAAAPTLDLGTGVLALQLRTPMVVAMAGATLQAMQPEREVLLGVTFIGTGVAELLHAATIAVVGEVPIARLWHAVPSFPTMSEIWLRLLEAYGL